MTLLTRLLPRTADNDYRGHPAALYTFCALATLMLGRSLIHFFKHDSGVNSAADIAQVAASARRRSRRSRRTADRATVR